MKPYKPGETLLIIDDDAINRAILEEIFSPFYQIKERENGRAGLEEILTGPERLCAVLLDVVMPGDGRAGGAAAAPPGGGAGAAAGIPHHRRGQRQCLERGLWPWRDGCDHKAGGALCGAAAGAVGDRAV